MTFEEFFNKKRIDLGLLKGANPALYSEFKSHFETMGEKSFDHTKKFWFNKLRHLYHLAEPVKKATTQPETQIASQAEPLSSPTIEQNVPAIQAETGQEVKAPASPKPGFRPRSIPAPAVQKTEQPADTKDDAASDKPAAPVSKPGFKPRNVKPVSGDLSEDSQKTASRPGQDIPSGASQGNAANTPRPAYKPRFNAGKIAEKTGDAEENEKEAIAGTTSPAQTTVSSKASASAAEQPKPAYKPRFNVKNIPAKENAAGDKDPGTEGTKDRTSAATSPVEHAVSESSSPADNVAKTSDGAPAAAIDSAVDPVAKPVYKPRFNLKTTIKTEAEEKEGNSVVKDPSTGTAEPEEHTLAAVQPTTEEAGSQSTQQLPEQRSGATEEVKVAAPKPAYKPRFNAKTITLKADDEAGASPSEQPAAPVDLSEKSQESAAEASEQPTKPAYKPRFNIKNIKPKE
ncbi:hypothetical protein B0I27_110113 [Arcticibacter pallidicorallinus]|uniref:Uncharacterized protein n=1 Tax=Arcticibacter pallidicorallinus TaxID=1259464 RepID=A0A2T0TW99_9SPHI|nr:hypothetical protein [Arcticibacter pallidicorallinus]PRY49939.1 hypothetical protein B0I27_110113 [Arcticibacter pallidicorallinus]